MTRDQSAIWGVSLDSLIGEELFIVPEEVTTNPVKTIDLRAKFYPYRDY